MNVAVGPSMLVTGRSLQIVAGTESQVGVCLCQSGARPVLAGTARPFAVQLVRSVDVSVGYGRLGVERLRLGLSQTGKAGKERLGNA